MFDKITLDAKKLREARGSRKVREVAELTGITPQMLCNYEAGTHSPNASTLLRLCLLYNVDIRTLKKDAVFLS